LKENDDDDDDDDDITEHVSTLDIALMELNTA
jgi:hypothetical protein